MSSSGGGEPVRVLLVDDHTLFREGVAEILAAEPGVAVAAEADNGQEAVKLAGEEQPDVVLLDVAMPGMGAEDAVRGVLRASPDSKIIVLTMYDEPPLVRRLLSVGAHAYIVKSAAREQLLAAVKTVHLNDDRVMLSVSRATLENLEGRAEKVLSPREVEVLSLAARAMSNAQVARLLYISEGTVKRHLTNIYAKLGVTSRVEAINKAITLGLVAQREGPQL